MNTIIVHKSEYIKHSIIVLFTQKSYSNQHYLSLQRIDQKIIYNTALSVIVT